MYKNILLPTDGSPFSEKAIACGVNLAKALDARVTGVYVKPKLSTFEILNVYEPEVLWGPHEAEKAKQAMAHVDELDMALATKYLGLVERAAKEAGVASETLYVTGESPSAGIIKTASEKGCDLIFMGSHGRTGIAGVLLGSVTSKVLAHSHIPVLVHRC
ncbi:MAG: universal stress protein [Nitrospirae bacterium]|nr:universal stress protein [Nitrospirota bacterium]